MFDLHSKQLESDYSSEVNNSFKKMFFQYIEELNLYREKLF